MIFDIINNEIKRQEQEMLKLNQSMEKARIKAGREILKLLDKADMTKTKLAKEVGVSRSTISRIIKGESNCSSELYQKIEYTLKMKV